MKFTEADWPSTRWPNFAHNELKCQETGELDIEPAFLDRLQLVRSELGRPLTVTSGYRSGQHSIELAKEKPGTHVLGVAADIAVASGGEAYELLQAALSNNRFAGIGLSLKGDQRFVHLDCAGFLCEFHVTRPTIWTY